MRLRSFTAPDMPTAMKLVREALGDGAIILNSEPIRGKKGIQVTAAVNGLDDDFVPAVKAVAAHPLRDDPGSDKLRFDLQEMLRFHNLPEFFVARLMQKATDRELSAVLAQHSNGQSLRAAVEYLGSEAFQFDPLPLDTLNHRLMMVGPAGAGKTLAIARMATKFAMDKHPVAVITTDNQRAGGIEQLQAFTSILNIDLKVANNRVEVAEYLASLPPRTCVLIDTAGCNPYDPEVLKDLAFYAALAGVEPVLVLPAGGDSAEAIDMVEAFMELPIARLLVTRTDTARRFGGVMAAASAHGLAFCHASTSPSVVDPLKPMDSGHLAKLLLRYQLQNG